jgi:hypothetical protein
MVHVRNVETGPWLFELESDNQDAEEKILIGTNGKVVLLSNGYLMELWPGFAEEPPIDIEDDHNPGFSLEVVGGRNGK